MKRLITLTICILLTACAKAPAHTIKPSNHKMAKHQMTCRIIREKMMLARMDNGHQMPWRSLPEHQQLMHDYRINHCE